MPVDRKLAYESLKWIDPQVYRMYCRLKYRGMNAEEIKNEGQTFYKLHVFELINDAIDRLEAEGYVEILNDYENEQILVRKNKVLE